MSGDNLLTRLHWNMPLLEVPILGYEGVDTNSGGARGGLGGYSPSSEHASPPSDGEKRFFRRFLAFMVP